MRRWGRKVLVALGLMASIAALMVGCVGQQDPYQRIEEAQAQIGATQRAEIQRKRAEVEAAREATQAAMVRQEEAQAEIDLMNARALGTQTALEMEVRVLELQAASGKATRAAWEYGQAVKGTQQAGEATATAMAIEMENARRTAEREEEAGRRFLAVKLIGMWALVIGIGIGLVIGLIYLWRWLDWKIEWTNRKNSIFTTAAGNTIVYVLSDGELLPQLMDGKLPRQAIRFGPGDGQTVQRLTQSGSVLASAPYSTPGALSEHERMVQAAIDLIEASIEQNVNGLGDEDTQIPRYDKLDMSSGVWQSVVGWLRIRKLAYSNTTGTFVTLPSLAHTRTTLMSHPPAPR